MGAGKLSLSRPRTAADIEQDSSRTAFPVDSGAVTKAISVGECGFLETFLYWSKRHCYRLKRPFLESHEQ